MTTYDIDQHVFEPESVLGWPPFNPPTQSLDDHERWLDKQGLDKAILFPTSTLLNMDQGVLNRYDEWILELCEGRPRFIPAQPVSLIPTHLWGQVVVIKPPITDWFSSEWLWKELTDKNKALALHTSVSSLYTGTGFFWESHVLVHPLTMMQTFVSMIARGVFDRHPKLRVAFLEGDAWWVDGLLSRMENHVEGVWKNFYSPSKRPEEYFRQNCWVALGEGEDESHAKYRALWGSDHPHVDKQERPIYLDERVFSEFAEEWLYGTNT